MIALIDYGMGNLLSVRKALEAVGADVVSVESASDARLAAADAVVLPGVGNFGDGIRNLRSRGFDSAVKDAVASGKPFLGICLGMQMLMEHSEEAPGERGLGVFKGSVRRFPSDLGLKIPQIGWNQVGIRGAHQCLAGVADGEFFYFVHSYFVDPDDKAIVAGQTGYGIDFCSAIGSGNVFATQFHPEKSQDAGLAILRNFAESGRPRE